MTAPRRVLPGAIKFVTRRCSERRFFLRPSPETTAILLYVLALAAKRYRVVVHAACVMSNHLHLVLTDTEARLPAFMQYFDSLVARAVNASIGHFEGFWESDCSYSAVDPLKPRDVLDKIAYTLANPVAAGLVKHGADWPGLWTAPEQIGTTTLVAHKPTKFFSARGYLPKVVELELTVPACFESAEEFRALLAEELRELEAKYQREMAAQGRRFLGAARVCAQDPFSSPVTSERRFKLNPRIAAKDKWRRIEGLFRVKSFEQEYRSSRASWCAGLRDVVFPAGTYLMRVMYGVRCAGAA